MFGFLKKLFSNPRAGRKLVVQDSVLGELRLSSDGDWWESVLTIEGRRVQFQIGGDSEPNSALVAHARDIAGDFAAFCRRVDEFLASAAKELPGAADEIRQLSLESICLFWPQEPDDGMLYFRGPDEFRVWRCDYIGRQPQGLGCDT